MAADGVLGDVDASSDGIHWLLVSCRGERCWGWGWERGECEDESTRWLLT